ncbi:MAG TPA: hypothetical protein VIP09_14230 [Dehalococcoidia bacterium]
MTTFERGFADVEKTATAAAQAAAAVVASAKQMQKAAIEGDIVKIRKASDRLESALGLARQEAANARSAWPYSQDEEEEYLRGDYEQELLEAAKAQGLKIQRQDERLVAFPSVVRIVPSERAARIDRKKVPAIRPTVLVALLKANQTKRPKFASDKFLEALYRAYRLIAGKDGVGMDVKLSKIYDAVTLLPGTTADYGKSDFGRDIFLLDRSGLTRLRSGVPFRLLRASTGTKEGKDIFSSVSPEGETVNYLGVSFSEGE